MIGVFGCFCDKKLYHLHDVKRLFKIQNYLNYGFFVGICKWFITNKVKKALKNENAPESIQNLYKEIAKIICLSAMGAYGKGKKVKK